MLNSILHDLGYSVRILIKNKGFALVLILTLAICIGANAAIFSVVNTVLVQPLPFPHPESVVAVFQTLPQQGITDAGASYPNLQDWRGQSHQFQEIAAVRNQTFTMTGSGDATYVVGANVSSQLFALLGVQSLRGRTLVADDDNLNAPPVAVIGEELWRKRFGGDSSAIGHTINLENQAYEIVGVMPASFRYPYGSEAPQVWVPLAKDPIFLSLMNRRKGHYLHILGRLKPGVSVAQGQADLAVVVSHLAEKYPENAGWGVRIVPLQERVVGDVRTPLLLLWAAVGLVLLIGGTNITNLLMGQATARGREFAVRAALGGNRARLVRQLLTECLVFGLIGGALGLVVTYIGINALSAVIPVDVPRIHEIRIDGWVLGFTFLISVVLSVVIGLAPALYCSRELQGTLREEGRGIGVSRLRLQLRNILVVAEVALSMLLLVGSGLVLRSFDRLHKVKIGFDPQNVIVGSVSLPPTQYQQPQRWALFFDQLIDRLKASPGSSDVAAALALPPFGSGLSFRFTIPGRPPQSAGEETTANYSAVSGDYFRVMRIPLERGRLFERSDSAASAKVCLISSAFARQYFSGEDPIGRQITFGYLEEVPRTIIGIVGDVKQVGLAVPFSPQMYVPYAQNPWPRLALVVRTSLPSEDFRRLLTTEVHQMDAGLPVTDVQPLTEIIDASIAEPRFRTLMFGLFGLAALFLAAVGVYGVMSFFVNQRTRDIGVRMALGAQRRDVLGMVVWHSVRLSVIGVVIGLLAALALGKAIASLLYGVSATDGLTFAMAGVLLIIVAVAACYLPARRAMLVDPITALRHD